MSGWIVVGRLMNDEGNVTTNLRAWGPFDSEEGAESIMSTLFWARPDDGLASRFDWVAAVPCSDDVMSEIEFGSGPVERSGEAS